MEQTPQPISQIQDNNEPNESNKSEEILNLDKKNRNCADCDSADNINYVSINNGITLCDKCYEMHKTFGNEISYLRKITDPFDEYLFKYMVLGGNSKIKDYIEKNDDIKNDSDLNSKYKKLLLYRINLKNRVTNKNEIEQIPEDKLNEKFFPEFENYELGKSNKSNLPEFLQKALNFTKEISNKIGDSKFGKTMKLGGEKIVNGVKTVGHVIDEKTQPARTYIVEKTTPVTDKIKQGASSIGDSIKEAYSNIVEKITGNNNTNNNNPQTDTNINASEI
jgi:hypothetical protein